MLKNKILLLCALFVSGAIYSYEREDIPRWLSPAEESLKNIRINVLFNGLSKNIQNAIHTELAKGLEDGTTVIMNESYFPLVVSTQQKYEKETNRGYSMTTEYTPIRKTAEIEEDSLKVFTRKDLFYDKRAGQSAYFLHFDFVRGFDEPVESVYKKVTPWKPEDNIRFIVILGGRQASEKTALTFQARVFYFDSRDNKLIDAQNLTWGDKADEFYAPVY